MLLTIDLGNTSLSLGLFEGQTLGARWRLATDHERMSDEYGLQILGLLQNIGRTTQDIDGICIASVVPPILPRIIQACHQYLSCSPFVVDHTVKTDIKILYDDPSAVGADRIVDAAAVQHHYGGPACIVDFGTATTFNALTREGEYLGGAIFPGIGVASDAIFRRGAKLFPVDIRRPPEVIGRNTTHALQSGLVFGYVAMVEGMVARFRAVLGEDTKVIATGGYSELIAPETNAIHIIAPWLTLEGLRYIWELNHSE